MFAPAEKRIRVPYSPTFLAQVARATSRRSPRKGDTVQGEFKKEVKYKGDTAKDFETEVPTFANDDQLSRLLTEQDVVINAEPPEQPLAAPDDPVLLRPDDPAGRAVHLPDATGGRGRRGRRRGARPVRALAREARGGGDADGHVRRRRRHRGGRGAARRGRRLPAQPAEVPQARAPASRAACCSRGRRAQARRCSPARWRARRRAVLLGLGLGVHRGDRRRGRVARARPLQAGRGGRPGDHLHRRARRDRARARGGRRRAGRPRRARADAQPDPHRDGRLRPRRRE